ncbi:MAG TPA: hypothetical protein VFA20_26620 [Myxococcaceae bacterium]|nr:hypothetical protein [Myxococcaceae bacterium]
MNINGFSSQISAFSGGPGGVGGSLPSSQSQLQRQDPGVGFPRNDTFESKSPRQTPGLGGVLKDSLAHAGVSQAKSKAVMDAVRNGASLDSALQSAGVTPAQHRSVMDSVRAQDKRKQR